MPNKNLTRFTFAGFLIIVISTHAWADGLILKDQDAEATARGNAFAATADNPSALYYNPAGITQLPGQQFRVGAYALTYQTRYRSPAGEAVFLRRHHFQGWKELPEVGFVAREDAVEAESERANQHVGQRTFRRERGAAAGHVLVPGQPGGASVGGCPWFLTGHGQVLEELLLERFAGVEDGSQFHIAHGANDEADGPLAVEELRGENAEARIGLGHVNQQAGVHHPGHQSRSPARSSAIHSSVVRGWGRTRRAKPSIAIAPCGAADGVPGAVCASSQASNCRACASSRCRTFSTAISNVLMAEI